MLESEQIQEMIDDVTEYVNEALRMLAEGKEHDLAELQPRITDLCAQLQHMRVDEAQHFLTPLANLYEQVDELRDIMLERQGEVRSELEELAQQKRASHAYAKSGSLSDSH